MPTYNRREFIPRAIERFHAQTYPNLELIVLDDGTDKIGDLLPPDNNIWYHHAGVKQNHGEKMNECCMEAQGNLCIVWDDDDWYSADRVQKQIEPLLNGDKIVSGTSCFYYHVKDTNDCYLYTCKPDLGGKAPWMGAIAFNRDWWITNPFKPLRNGADLEFLRTVPRDLWADLHDLNLLVSTIHSTNSGDAGKRLHPDYFLPVPYEVVQGVMR